MNYQIDAYTLKNYLFIKVLYMYCIKIIKLFAKGQLRLLLIEKFISI
jgi:hypothetical protein